MLESNGFGKRLYQAMQALNLAEGREITDAELAKRVSEELGKGKAYSHTAVGRWRGGSIPSVPVVAAIAKVTRVDPGWLAFGSGSSAPVPPALRVSADDLDIPPATSTRATEQSETGETPDAS